MSEAEGASVLDGGSATTRDVVVVGASAGGVEALRELVSFLPPDFPAAVLVVLHVPAAASSSLPAILDRAGPLPARHAAAEESLQPATVLVAPPDRHLVAHPGGVTTSPGPKENGHRPAIDVLFRSAARAYGNRVIAVVLSGALDDGSAGMVAVRLRGGIGLAQDFEEALLSSMPRAAARVAELELVLPVQEIAAALVELVGQPVAGSGERPSPLMEMEADMANLDLEALTVPERPGEPSGWTCPDCYGSLFEIHEGGYARFRCRVGHAWSEDSLMAQQAASLESALWIALRTLEEKVTLTLDLGRRAVDRGHQLTGQQFQRQAEDAQRSAGILRHLIEDLAGLSHGTSSATETH